MKRFTLPLFVLLFVLTGCPGDSEDVTPDATCITTAAACAAAGTFETCANTRSAWYTWRGTKYPCASMSDCTGAATQLTNDILSFCD